MPPRPWQTRISRDHATVFLLLFYFVISLFFLGNWEFTFDDQNTLSWSLRSWVHPFWSGVISSVGVAHTPFVYYFYGLIYLLFGSITALQIALIVLILLGHFFLIRTGPELGHPKLGFVASFLFFFSPSFFVFYNQKFWEVTALPTFSVIGLFYLLRFVNTNKWRHFYLSLVSVVLAISCHQAAILYLPILSVAALRSREEGSLPRVPWFHRLGIMALVLIGLSTALKWVWETRFTVYPTLGPAFFPTGDMDSLQPIRNFVDLLSGLTHYIPGHIGRNWPIWPRWLQYFPEALLLSWFIFLSLFRYRYLPTSRKIVLFWFGIPLIVLMGSPFLCFRSHPHQWSVVCFPAAWLAVLFPLFDALQRPSRRIRLGIITFLSVMGVHTVIYSLSLARFVWTSGGVGWHSASLSTRTGVLEQIYQESPSPRIIFIPNQRLSAQAGWGYDYEGWKFLNWNYLLNRTSKSNPEFYYLLPENGRAAAVETRQKIEKTPGVQRKDIGSISVYRSDRWIPIEGFFIN